MMTDSETLGRAHTHTHTHTHTHAHTYTHTLFEDRRKLLETNPNSYPRVETSKTFVRKVFPRRELNISIREKPFFPA